MSLHRGIAAGICPLDADTNAFASFYTAIIDGLAMQARDGASRKTLAAIVDCAMAAWDRLAPAPKRGWNRRVALTRGESIPSLYGRVGSAEGSLK